MAVIRKSLRWTIVAAVSAACLIVAAVWVFQVRRADSRPAPTSTPPLVCVYNGYFMPAHSPVCTPDLTTGRPLPATGPCSIRQAKMLPAVSIDFRRYINKDFIARPAWRFRVERGYIVSFPAETYDIIRTLAPEAPKGPVAMYRITSQSFESIEQSIPALYTVMTHVGVATDMEFYVTTHRCLPDANPTR